MGYSQRDTTSMGVGGRAPVGVTAASMRRVQDGTAPQPTVASLIRMETRTVGVADTHGPPTAKTTLSLSAALPEKFFFTNLEKRPKQTEVLTSN